MGNTAPISCDYSFNWENIECTSENALPAREGHSGVFYNNSLYFFGGIQDCSATQNNNDDENDEVLYPTSCMNDMYQYDIQENKWHKINCTGEIPSPRSGFVSAVLNDQLFVYGGLDPLYGWLNDGFTYNFQTKNWQKVNFSGCLPSPRDKIGYANLDDNKLVFFGGFGPQEIELEEGEEETATFGWFNDSFIFDSSNHSWTKLSCNGDLPTPRAAAGVTIVRRPKQILQSSNSDNSQTLPEFQETGESIPFLYVMGGRDNQGSRTNDVFSLDLQSYTWEKHACRGTAPIGRSFHSCVTVNDKLFIFGGTTPTNQVINDIHILDTRAASQHAWIQPKDQNLDISKQPSPRAFHATITANENDDVIVYVHGGTSKLDNETGEHQNLCPTLWKINLCELLVSSSLYFNLLIICFQLPL